MPNPVIHSTRDFDVAVRVSADPALPEESRARFFVIHRQYDVMVGHTPFLHEAIWGAEEIQVQLDAALKSPKKRPERELSQLEHAALLGMTVGGDRN